uniref:Uncharacterized protein n=1 Tax=Arundo donax TaxID=35708 RepID=A0A0A8XNV7_ARUDO
MLQHAEALPHRPRLPSAADAMAEFGYDFTPLVNRMVND